MTSGSHHSQSDGYFQRAMADDSYFRFDIDQTIQETAASLGVAPARVGAAVELLEAGNTLPFIARYR